MLPWQDGVPGRGHRCPPHAPARMSAYPDTDCIRLVAADHDVEGILLPIRILLRPVAVKPEAADRTVVPA